MRKSVTLECSAINVNKSITRLDYQWQKEFVDISGASKNTYETLEPGSYRCKITNGYRTVYTQDAIVTLEPIWVTDIIINTQSITNSGKIQYTINPEEADDKTVTFDANITPDYTIDAAGNVTINTDGCKFEVVARSQFGKDYTEVKGTKTITGYIRVAVKPITITTATIQDTGQIQTSVSPENASIAKKEFELLSGSEYVVMDSTGYVSEVKSPGTFSVRVSGFDKTGNVVTNTREIICKTSDYFIAKTARGNKTGRGSWDNATDDIKTFGTGSVIKLGDTYIETGKVCDVGGNQLDLGGCVIGGCEFGSFVPKSNNDRSDISNISSSDFGVSVEQTSAIIANCDFYNINSGRYGVDVIRTFAIITNCDFYNINSGRFYGVDVVQTSATFTNCDFCNISGGRDGVDVAQTSATIISCEFHNISGGSFGVGVVQTSATIANCIFCNISGGFYGVYVTQTSATIENCTFSAIESNSSTRYTPYSSLTSILPPETGCKFLPEGKAQSIYFNDDCIINGKKVSDLLNS
nr:MAG TPA: Right handed beta helix region [Caudoviricetes sp.]